MTYEDIQAIKVLALCVMVSSTILFIIAVISTFWNKKN
jgi:hypothetical protein